MRESEREREREERERKREREAMTYAIHEYISSTAQLVSTTEYFKW